MLRRHLGGGKGLQKILVHVAAKVGRIVGVDRGHQARIQQSGQVVVTQIGEDTQLLVRQRAHRQRNPVLRQALHQRGVVDGLHPVIDTFRLQHIQRRPDIGRRPLFPRMGHHMQPQRTAACEHLGKLLGWVAQLAGVQPHTHQFVTERQCLLQRLERSLLTQMPQETQDQRRTDAKPALCIHTRTV